MKDREGTERKVVTTELALANVAFGKCTPDQSETFTFYAFNLITQPGKSLTQDKNEEQNRKCMSLNY